MEATIKANQMDVYKEEARTGPDVESIPQERHVWRIPGLPPISQEKQKKRSGKYAQAFCRGNELLLTHQQLSGSGEDHRALRRVEPTVLQRKGQNNKELVEETKSFIHRPEEGTGNDSSFGERRPSGIYQLQKCPKTSPKDLRRSIEVPRPSKEKEKEKEIGTDLTHRGTGSPNLSLQKWIVS
ncbi:hypothetical protein O181_008354 [Austropuccinia psidii MF-1]|uniref:Uncharacterized protein n=1 Tax=Austropuccinia psidii MF-1 TaxID=1389203 RepID=A0A9Q3GIS7_9BASI|nr:hypothetical protein [Austropuccinia psidii MF-1]